MNKNQLDEYFTHSQDHFIDQWKEFLRFESISTDPEYNSRCVACAEWLVTKLKAIGFNSELLQTPTKPVVYAEYKGKPGAPVVLYYGHYDVQPVDPLELWETKPFEPTEKNGRIYARGAQDNKGQNSYAFAAFETLIKNNALNCTLRLFIEGEEESGSEGLSAAMQNWPDKLKGDLLMVCDTGVVPSGAPTITMGLRGIIHFTVKLKGSEYDLHSGVHGGAVPNPATEMARLMASLHAADGSIAVDGYYSAVRKPSAQDLKLAEEGVPSDEIYKAFVGVAPVGGEVKYSVAERVGFRPTVEVNGIHSGYGGAGHKTIIPAFAEAKVSSRIVPDQDPEEMMQLLVKHLEKHAPRGLTLEISDRAIGGPAITVSAHSQAIQKAHTVLSQLSEQKTVYRWEGASIPIVSGLCHLSGAEPVLVGFGMEEDRIHAPNESFSLEQFKRGFMYVGLFLSTIA